MSGNGGAVVGRDLRVQAELQLGELSPDELRVELYYGKLDEDGQLSGGQARPMTVEGTSEDGKVRYQADMPCTRSGRTGYTVRVRPRHPDVAEPLDMGLLRWA
jgi:starch phosphorylase